METERLEHEFAIQNLSSDYQEHIRWVHDLKANKSYRGRLYYGIYLIWDTFGQFTSLLLIITSVLATVASFTRNMLMEDDLYRSAVISGFVGVGIGSLLVFIDTLTFWMGAFTDTRTRYRIRNYWHKGYLFLLAVTWIVAVIMIYALVRLFTMSPEEKKDYSFKNIFLH